MGIIDCLYVGPSVDQQLNHFAVAPFPILIYGMVQWSHAGLILKIHVPALIEILFDSSRYLQLTYIPKHDSLQRGLDKLNPRGGRSQAKGQPRV